MKIYTQIPVDLPPTALTIGTFDGLHLGHLAILHRLKKVSSHGTMLTFANHPLELIRPPAPLFILSRDEKLALLASFGIDAVIELPFTSELANLSYEDLLSRFPLTHLILGEHSVFGKDRKGTAPQVLQYAKKNNFSVEYIPKVHSGGSPISSSRIRQAIGSGDFKTASQLLGRPHRILLTPRSTLENSLILPPDGSYRVKAGDLSTHLEITTIAQGRHLALSKPITAPTFITFEDIS